MLISRALSRASRSLGGRSLLVLSSSSSSPKQQLPILSNQLKSLAFEHPSQVSLFHHSALNLSPFQRFGFTSSTSPEPNEKQQGTPHENNDAPTNADPAKTNGDASSDQGEDSVAEDTNESGFNSESQSVKRERRGTKRTAFSDSDSDSESDSESYEDLTKDELIKHLGEKEELLKLKQKDYEQKHDKILRAYAEIENVMERTKREAENSKKFAVQSFAKGLLDVADNLGRASSVVKDSFSKVDESKDTAGVVPILKTLLEGVEMTEKQLSEVFRKFGIEKYDPTNEPFDPHRHNAVFQVPDASKPPGTVAHVLKAGYMLYDRVIRPAEVGVTQAVENNTEANNE